MPIRYQAIIYNRGGFHNEQNVFFDCKNNRTNIDFQSINNNYNPLFITNLESLISNELLCWKQRGHPAMFMMKRRLAQF